MGLHVALVERQIPPIPATSRACALRPGRRSMPVSCEIGSPMAKSAIRSDICAVRLTAHTLTRGIATVALLGLVLLSCDGNRLTDTGARAPLRPSMSHITVPPPAGSYDLPDPANSGGDGSAVSERETGITIPEGDHYVRVRVTGGIVITSTDPAAPINGYMVGPWGLTSHTPFQYCDVDSCALSVVPRFYNTPTTSTGFFLNDVGNYLGESVALVTGPGWFTVERMGLSCAGDEGPCLYFSGHQTLSIDFVALALHASDTTRAAGEVVHFEAEGVNVNLGTPVFWEWWPAGADDFTLVDACADHLECDFAPPSDGLMEAQSWVGDGMGSGYVAGEVKIRLATEAAAVTIIKAEGPNGGSFTTIPGENRLSLEASVMPAESSPAWELIDEPEDQVQTRPPGNVEPTTGTTVEADMPPQDPNRWRNVPHPGTLKEKSLAVRVTAIVTGPGGEVRSPERWSPAPAAFRERTPVTTPSPW